MGIALVRSAELINSEFFLRWTAMKVLVLPLAAAHQLIGARFSATSVRYAFSAGTMPAIVVSRVVSGVRKARMI